MAFVTIMLVAINIFGEKEGRRKSGISTTMKKLLNGCNCFKRKLVYSGASLSEGINLWNILKLQEIEPKFLSADDHFGFI